MPQFLDKSGQSWDVNLDPVVALEIQEKHQIELTNLESDPMLKLRVDPMILVSVMHLICQEQISQRDLKPTDFARLLPFPPDPMLTAIEEAIAAFFPTGRASHVAEVLAAYQQMGEETDALTTEKMRKLISDPGTKKRISEVADQQIAEAMKTLTLPGTSTTEGETASL